MGLSDRMNIMADNMKQGAKNSTLSAIHMFLRLITGFFLGLTLGLIFQTFIGYGTFALLFFIVVTIGVIWKIMSSWSFGQIFIFDLICVLVAMLLRMYILLAP